MRRKAKGRNSNRQKTKLGLPDLEHVKSTVPVSLRSPESQRNYQHSIDDFVATPLPISAKAPREPVRTSGSAPEKAPARPAKEALRE
jgi:hypothetical protein